MARDRRIWSHWTLIYLRDHLVSLPPLDSCDDVRAAGGQEGKEEREVQLQAHTLQILREASDADVVGHRVSAGQHEVD